MGFWDCCFTHWDKENSSVSSNQGNIHVKAGSKNQRLITWSEVKLGVH